MTAISRERVLCPQDALVARHKDTQQKKGEVKLWRLRNPRVGYSGGGVSSTKVQKPGRAEVQHKAGGWGREVPSPLRWGLESDPSVTLQVGKLKGPEEGSSLSRVVASLGQEGGLGGWCGKEKAK